MKTGQVQNGRRNTLLFLIQNTHGKPRNIMGKAQNLPRALLPQLFSEHSPRHVLTSSPVHILTVCQEFHVIQLKVYGKLVLNSMVLPFNVALKCMPK